MIRAAWAVVGLLVAVVICSGPMPATAEQQVVSPTITLDRSRVHPGEKVIVVFSDWQSRSATVAVCGNLARRGSTDCNLVDGQGVALAIGAPRMIAEFVPTLPPVPCPCVVEAWSTAHTEVAFAPVEIIGAPIGPILGSPVVAPLAVSLRVERSAKGAIERLRAALGGPTTYEVTLTLQNQSGGDLSDISVNAQVGRSPTDVIKSFDLSPPPIIPAGHVLTQRTHVTVPAPSIGRMVWEVTVSGSGPPVHTAARASASAGGLVAVAALFIADLVMMVGRRVLRRQGVGKKAVAEHPGPPTLRVVFASASSAA